MSPDESNPLIDDSETDHSATDDSETDVPSRAHPLSITKFERNLLDQHPSSLDKITPEQRNKIRNAKRKADEILQKTPTKVQAIDTDLAKQFLELRLR